MSSPNRQFQVRMYGKYLPTPAAAWNWRMDLIIYWCSASDLIQDQQNHKCHGNSVLAVGTSEGRWHTLTSCWQTTTTTSPTSGNQIVSTGETGYKHTNLEWQHSKKKTRRASQRMLKQNETSGDDFLSSYWKLMIKTVTWLECGIDFHDSLGFLQLHGRLMIGWPRKSLSS